MSLDEEQTRKLYAAMHRHYAKTGRQTPTELEQDNAKHLTYPN